MKNLLYLLLIFFHFSQAEAQPVDYTYQPSQNLAVPLSKLATAKTVYDLEPQFCRYMALPFREQGELDALLNRQIFLLMGLPSMRANRFGSKRAQAYNQDDFDKLIDYESVTISSKVNGDLLTATGKTCTFTQTQRSLLARVKPGNDVELTIRYRFRDKTLNGKETPIVKSGQIALKIVPEKEAEFPGGSIGLEKYFQTQVSDQIDDFASVMQAVVVFEIGETGKTEHIRMEQSSGNKPVDQSIVKALRAMPVWKPAQDEKGKKVKQLFRFLFSSNGC